MALQPSVLAPALSLAGDRRQTTFTPATLGDLAVRLELGAAQSWLVSEYIGAGELLVLYGPGKVGKSTFAASLAAAVARGVPFLGRATTQGTVLWLDNENHARRVVSKLAEAGCPADAVLVSCGPPPAAADLRDRILEHGVRLLIVDSLIGHLRPEDENDAAQARALIAPLLDLAHETEASILAIHHARKSGGDHGDAMRGSSAVRDAVDGYLQMTRVGGGEPDDERRQLAYEGRDESPPRQLVVRRQCTPADQDSVIRSEAGVPVVQTHVTYTLARGPSQERRDKILAVLCRGTRDAEALAAEVGVSRALILGDLDTLRSTGRVTRDGTGRKGSPYTYSLPSSDSFAVQERGGITE